MPGNRHVPTVFGNFWATFEQLCGVLARLSVSPLKRNRGLYTTERLIYHFCSANKCKFISDVANVVNLGRGGGGIFIYSCSQTIKTIDFKRN